MVGEDRKRYGLVPTMTVKHNVTLANLKRCCRGPLVDHRTEGRVADEQIREFSIKAHHRNQWADTLSGGNQQKIVLAKAWPFALAAILAGPLRPGHRVGGDCQSQFLGGCLPSSTPHG